MFSFAFDPGQLLRWLLLLFGEHLARDVIRAVEVEQLRLSRSKNLGLLVKFGQSLVSVARIAVYTLEIRLLDLPSLRAGGPNR